MEVVEMEIAHLELRYAHTRIIKRESLVALAASIEHWGQIIPVITVAPRVLIDGYRRMAADPALFMKALRSREEKQAAGKLRAGPDKRIPVGPPSCRKRFQRRGKKEEIPLLQPGINSSNNWRPGSSCNSLV